MVCTANICRSATGQLALTTLLPAHDLTSDAVSVTSAGVAAAGGYSMCETSEQLLVTALPDVADAIGAHSSRRLTREFALAADLILTADRSHRGAVVQLAPGVRSRVFTLRQAARLATWIVGDSDILRVACDLAAGRPNPFPAEDPRSLTAPLPATSRARLAWLVAEMDANRGMAPRPTFPAPADSVSTTWHEEDVEDPHVAGWPLHEQSVTTIVTCSQEIATALVAVVGGSAISVSGNRGEAEGA